MRSIAGAIHTLVEKKQSLSLLYIDSSSRSEERWRRSANVTITFEQSILPHTLFVNLQTRYVAASLGNRQTYRTTTVTLAHVPRVNYVPSTVQKKQKKKNNYHEIT